MFNEFMCKRIKKRLIDKQMTQKELGDRIGVSLAYINQILNNKCENLEIETKILRELELSDTRSTSQ